MVLKGNKMDTKQQEKIAHRETNLTFTNAPTHLKLRAAPIPGSLTLPQIIDQRLMQNGLGRYSVMPDPFLFQNNNPGVGMTRMISLAEYIEIFGKPSPPRPNRATRRAQKAGDVLHPGDPLLGNPRVERDVPQRQTHLPLTILSADKGPADTSGMGYVPPPKKRTSKSRKKK